MNTLNPKSELNHITYSHHSQPKTLRQWGLWVFILIYCSTFLFLANVKLRLTLEFLTINDRRVKN